MWVNAAYEMKAWWYAQMNIKRRTLRQQCGA
jgi:hypothetical protein